MRAVLSDIEYKVKGNACNQLKRCMYATNICVGLLSFAYRNKFLHYIYLLYLSELHTLSMEMSEIKENKTVTIEFVNEFTALQFTYQAMVKPDISLADMLLVKDTAERCFKKMKERGISEDRDNANSVQGVNIVILCYVEVC